MNLSALHKYRKHPGKRHASPRYIFGELLTKKRAVIAGRGTMKKQ